MPADAYLRLRVWVVAELRVVLLAEQDSDEMRISHGQQPQNCAYKRMYNEKFVKAAFAGVIRLFQENCAGTVDDVHLTSPE